VIPVGRIDELRADPDAIARLAHAPFEDGGDAELAADLAGVDVLALEGEGGGARRDSQPGKPAEEVQKLLREAVREVLLLLVRAQVDERQHGNRRCRIK